MSMSGPEDSQEVRRSSLGATSYRNLAEVDVVTAVVKLLLSDSSLAGPGDIGVISPYSAQVKVRL